MTFCVSRSAFEFTIFKTAASANFASQIDVGAELAYVVMGVEWLLLCVDGFGLHSWGSLCGASEIH